MRFHPALVLSAALMSFSAAVAHAQIIGAPPSDVANDAQDPGLHKATPPSFGAGSNLSHGQRCALQPSQSTAAERLAHVLLEHARSAWDAAEHQPTASRESQVERAIVRTVERINECSIITHRAMSLAREAFAHEDPSNRAFDNTLTAMDVVEQGRSCDCRPGARPGPAFGGPPLGGSGGGGGGVTHPPVAPPQ